MNWTKDKSVTLSQICVVLFAVLLLALDILAYPVLKSCCNTETAVGFPGGVLFTATMHWQAALWLLVGIGVGSVFAWGILLHLWRLLRHIRQGEIFDELTVRHLRAVSWGCVGVAVVCLLTGLVFPLLLVIAVAAGFMALIVRIVKNAFRQAVDMKNELDLTI